MLKKIVVLLLFCSKVIALDSTCETNKEVKKELSTMQTIFVVGWVGLVGAATVVVVGPLIIPASGIAAIKAAAVTVTVKAAATGTAVATKVTTAAVATKSAVIAVAPVIGATSKVVGVVKIAKLGFDKTKDYIDPPIEQKVAQLLKEKAARKPFEERLAEELAKK